MLRVFLDMAPESEKATEILKLLLVTATFSYLLARALSRPRKPTNGSNPPLPPGPVPWPVFGSLPAMLLNRPAFRWIHAKMKDSGSEIACFQLGSVHVVAISSPEIAREVLRKNDASFMSRPITVASHVFSGGYRSTALSPYGEQWKKMRRVLSSDIICPSRLAWLHDKRANEADNLTRYIYNLATTGTITSSATAVDVRHVARHYSGNILRRLLFNRRYFGEPQADGGPGPMEVLHIDTLFTSLGHLFAFSISDYVSWLRGFDLDGHEKTVKQANKVLNSLHGTIIDDRWRKWKEGDRQESEDLLDVLIALQDGQGNTLLTIEEVKAQCLDIALAAVDNPSNAVEWAMAEMMNKPAVMAKAVDELDRVVSRERLLQESDIPKLNYLKACIREAFRLHPVAPFNVPHLALADTTIAGYRVPKGSHVILSRMGLGRNPRTWDEPLIFNPDRHLATPSSDVSLTEHDLRFISFSTGRRGCVAASLGTAMSIMLIGRLLQAFTWSKPPGVEMVDLSESKSDMFMATPLLLHAEPRLPTNLYPHVVV